MSKKMFISHATMDKDLILAFLRFLKDGLGIDDNDVFCTSLSDAIKTGKDFIPKIKENLQNCKKVIFFITENYFKSPFCLAELGAAWAISQDILPLIIPPVEIAKINRTPLLGIQVRSIGNQNDLAVIRDEFLADGIANQRNTAQFMDAVNKFHYEIKKYERILTTDSEGYAIATVIEYGRVREYDVYRIKEQLDLGEYYNGNETHLLAYKPNPNWYLRFAYNEQLKFKPADIREDTTHHQRNEKLFIIPDLWALDIKLP